MIQQICLGEDFTKWFGYDVYLKTIFVHRPTASLSYSIVTHFKIKFIFNIRTKHELTILSVRNSFVLLKSTVLNQRYLFSTHVLLFSSMLRQMESTRINLFLVSVPILYSQKTPENQRFSGVFRKY